MARARAFLEPIQEFFSRLDVWPEGIVVAVSGGADSVALLRALAEIFTGRLVVAHLNHCLRGNASDADEQFVAQLVDAIQAKTSARATFQVDRRKVADAAGTNNLESTARRIRYEWLTQVAQTEGIGWVATGHTADDQAETVLFRLLRGTGLAGLAGIPACRPLATGVELLRPLIHVTRNDVLAYLHELGQQFREDSSNADARFTRNRIRKDLLPHLAKDYNPRVREVLCRLADQAADALCEIESPIVELLLVAERPRAGNLLVFDRAVLNGQPRHRLRSLWRHVWEREDWPRQAMGFAEWDRLADLCMDGSIALSLPGQIEARRRANVIQVGPAFAPA